MRNPLHAACLLAAALCCAGHGRAAAAAAKEAEVKAAFIYNFTQFVEWEAPPSSGAAAGFDICVLGDDPVAQPLAALPSAELKGAKVRVRLLAGEAEARSCRILFISRSARRDAAEAARQLRGPGVLTVSDAPRFARGGGVIGFFTENNRIRLEINLKAAREAGLRVSSRLLEVSRLVQERP